MEGWSAVRKEAEKLAAGGRKVQKMSSKGERKARRYKVEEDADA